MTPTLPILPTGHKFAVAFVEGLGGVVVALVNGQPTLWHASKKISDWGNRVAYDAACKRAITKLSA